MTQLYFSNFSVAQEKVQNRHRNDDEVADNTPHIRHLLKDDQAHQRGKDDLAEIIDRDLLSGSVGIGGGDTELRQSRRDSRTEQIDPLQSGHRNITRDHDRRYDQRRARREEEHDEGIALPHQPELTHAAVSGTRHYAAEESHQRRDESGVRKAGLDHKQCTEQRAAEDQPLIDPRPLLDEDKRKQYREERRHFVQDRRVREHERFKRVIVADNARQSE